MQAIAPLCGVTNGTPTVMEGILSLETKAAPDGG